MASTGPAEGAGEPAGEVTLVAPAVGPLGGMERMFAELAQGLLARRYRVTVVALACELPPHPRLRVVRVRGPRRPATLAFPWFALAASVALARHARGIVHAQGAIVPRRVDVISVQFCHHAFQAGWSSARRRRDTLPYRLNELLDARLNVMAERWCYRPGRLGALVTVSRGVEGELRRFFAALDERIAVVANGVDLEEFRPDPRARAEVRRELGVGDGLLAAFVGGDWERKGLRHAVAALTDAPAWSLVVVGAGDEGRIAALADSLGVGDRVLFVGHVGRPARHLAAADAFVLPSAYEAFPLVAIEAAAAGAPLLVTRINGTEELVVDGESGFFVERSGPSIAARLVQLQDAPELRDRLAAGARTAAEGLTWPRAVEGYVRVYERLGGAG